MVNVADANGLISGFAWDSTTVFYAFPDAVSEYPDPYSVNDELTSFQPLDETARDWFRVALQEYENVTGLTLTEVASSADVDAIRIADSDAPAVAYAYLPTGDVADGDIWFDMDRSILSRLSSTAPIIGSYEWHTAIHEVGHALGLKHGHEIDYGQPALDPSVDGMELTVMTYRSYIGDPTATFYSNETWGYAQSLMVLDIAALQQLYGPNYDYASDANIYTADPDTGEVFRDDASLGTPGDNRIFRTLWDGGGEDTVDFSNYLTALDIDLAPGQGVDLDAGGNAQAARLASGIYADRQIYFALLHENDPRGLIENAVGGFEDDLISGNDGSNRLVGGPGGDFLTGRLGADVFSGKLSDLAGDTIADFAADDMIHVSDTALDPDTIGLFALSEGSLFSLSPGNFMSLPTVSLGQPLALLADGGSSETTIRMEASSDVFLGVGATRYISSFSDSQVIVGNDLANSISLSSGDDMIDAGAGADLVFGGEGDDILIGGAGQDILSGGAGADSFVFRAKDDVGVPSLDRVTDFEVGVDHIVFEGFSGAVVISEINGDALLSIGSYQFVQLEGVASDAALTPSLRAAETAFAALGQVEWTVLSAGNDRYVSRAEADEKVDGGDGVDAISTGAGNDVLFGGAGADLLFSGAGMDRLSGGLGSDLLTGGADADTFVFDLSEQRALAELDRITDFEIGFDSIELWETPDDFEATYLTVGNELALSLGPSWLVVFEELDAIESLPESSITWV